MTLRTYMLIGGFQKVTLLDYPGKIAAIVFTVGCNFRCHYCYNPMLVVHNGEAEKPKDLSIIAVEDLLAFFRSRVGKLEAVVVTGGEPTIQADLPEFLAQLKNLGLLIKLDTNGTNPQMLQKLLDEKLVDYIAMDLKAPLDDYAKVVAIKIDTAKISQSIKLIMASGLPYEFRTTIVRDLLTADDIAKMGQAIAKADVWYLQQFQANHDLVDQNFKTKQGYSSKELRALAKIGGEYVKKCAVRGIM